MLRSASITCSTKGSQEPTEAVARPRSLDRRHDAAALTCVAAAATQMSATASSRRSSDRGLDTASVRSWLCLVEQVIDADLGTPRGPQGCDYGARRLRNWSACSSSISDGGVQQAARDDPHWRRTRAQPVARARAWIIVSVTVLIQAQQSVPVLERLVLMLALANKQRLIRSQVRALIATDRLLQDGDYASGGNQCNGSRAKGAKRTRSSDR